MPRTSDRFKGAKKTVVTKSSTAVKSSDIVPRSTPITPETDSTGPSSTNIGILKSTLSETVGARKRRIEEVSDTMDVARIQSGIGDYLIPVINHEPSMSCVPLITNVNTSFEYGQRCTSTTPTFPCLNQSFNSKFRSYLPTPSPTAHLSPLPMLNWADSKEVWAVMMEKDRVYTRDTSCLSQHAGIQPRMRSILLDWLIEVCEVYRLHRETYYLAMDFLDRFLSSQFNITKQQLQLLGITTLFIAAKLEEIYPPKLSEFAYVTDGACTESNIMDMELIILKALNWDLSPITVNSWLNIFLQLANIENTNEDNDNFIMPQYSGNTFVQIAQLLDLCTLDIQSLYFPYSLLAASAMYHMFNCDVTLDVSGLDWEDIAPCVRWMASFAGIVKEKDLMGLKPFNNIPDEDLHNIQTHVNELSMLERAQQCETFTNIKPPALFAVLTPPHSAKKKR